MRYNSKEPSYFTTGKHIKSDVDNKLNDIYIGGLGLPNDVGTPLVVIKLSYAWILKLISRTIILALLILSFPSINSFMEDVASNFHGRDLAKDPMDTNHMLPRLFQDLETNGILYRLEDKALILSKAGNDDVIAKFKANLGNNVNVIRKSDLDNQDNLNLDESFDFVFSDDFKESSSFLERSLKVGGVVVVELSNNPMVAFEKPSNFKIIYLKRFDSNMMMAMRKTTSSSHANSLPKRKLFGFTNDARKDALRKLENVLLEPPRAASGKSLSYGKRTRYLPDLLGDSLENYPRRVFIDVGLHEASTDDWFLKNYPTRNTHFEMYRIDTVPSTSSESPESSESGSGEEKPQAGMSDWLEKNIKENEFVVMKAEAEVVEEMIKNKSIRLVDELFLECKHQGIKTGEKGRRAYWECLSLYGILRDEGVAAHQWWG